MAERAPGAPRARGAGLVESWRRLNVEQRVVAIGALLLIVSTFGPFSFVEVAEILVAGGVLFLLKKRADGRVFHLPFGDGTVIFVAGIWAAILIVVRLFDRPLGQGLLALVCAAILILAGVRERAKRPPDDLPPESRPGPQLARRRGPVPRPRPPRPSSGEEPTRRMPGAAPVPEPEAPPEFEVTQRLAGDEEKPDPEPLEQLELPDDPKQP